LTPGVPVELEVENGRPASWLPGGIRIALTIPPTRQDYEHACRGGKLQTSKMNSRLRPFLHNDPTDARQIFLRARRRLPQRENRQPYLLLPRSFPQNSGTGLPLVGFLLGYDAVLKTQGNATD